ncbi:hypothetical protein [Methanospirillum lacunae]|uniref:Uncharacterized protein n=1 Tax=Methanospirillum lacunae TaxID=668570 RepID=A0A2V2N974_9EURY|nr:hypothetical protein [Methanospirillum lacunae]PWR74206.1 hypothetical protein DK846_03390 [Methanospirillum lacunae]
MSRSEDRICPFISSGTALVTCLGKRCTACRSVITGEDRFMICLLIDRELYDSVEVDDAWI